MKKLELAEAPVLQVSKGGVNFTVPEIPIYRLSKAMQGLALMTPEGVDDALKAIFGDGNIETARRLFTADDIKAVIGALRGAAEDGPLASASEAEATESPSD